MNKVSMTRLGALLKYGSNVPYNVEVTDKDRDVIHKRVLAEHIEAYKELAKYDSGNFSRPNSGKNS